MESLDRIVKTSNLLTMGVKKKMKRKKVRKPPIDENATEEEKLQQRANALAEGQDLDTSSYSYYSVNTDELNLSGGPFELNTSLNDAAEEPTLSPNGQL